MEEELFNFLEAQSLLAEDLEDGAYLNFLQDSVELFNKDHDTDYNPYETMMAYIKEPPKN